MDWATLMRRVWGWELMKCPCGGRLEWVAVVKDNDSVEQVLRHLELWTDVPPRATARAPP